MKTVMLEVIDDSKFQLLLDFLQEIRFVQIAPSLDDISPIKTMTTLPPSVVHPHSIKMFTKFSREELHAR